LDHSSESARTVAGWKRWLPRTAVAVLVPVLLLMVTEAALRLFGVGAPSGVTRPCTIRGRPGSCSNEFFSRVFFPVRMARTPRPYAILRDKQPGTVRIVILGESAAYGDPDPTYGFGRYLEMMLRERYPDTRFEIINTGVTAINSHVVLRIAQDLADKQPDLFLVYMGNNEVVGPYGPGTVITSAASNRAAIHASILVRSTRIGQLLGSLGASLSSGPGSRSSQEWRGMEMFLQKQVRADAPAMGPVYRNLAANLRDIIAAGRSAGAKVLVSTVPTNERDCAPFASMHRDSLDAAALEKWSERMEQGKNLEAAGAYGDALKSYLSAAEIDWQYAELQFRIARSLWMLGDYPAARERYGQARDLDTLRFRADTKINDIIRSVATSAGPGVELVDAERVLADQSPHGVTGDEFFYEHVHFNPRGNYTIASVFFNRMQVQLGLPDPATSEDVLSEAGCERLLAFTGYDRARILRDLQRRLQRPPFTNQLNHAEGVEKVRLAVDGHTEAPEQTTAEYRWAIARHPDDQLLHLNFGLFLHPYDRNAAQQQFRMARPFDDASYLANWRKMD